MDKTHINIIINIQNDAAKVISFFTAIVIKHFNYEIVKLILIYFKRTYVQMYVLYKSALLKCNCMINAKYG